MFYAIDETSKILPTKSIYIFWSKSGNLRNAQSTDILMSLSQELFFRINSLFLQKREQ